MKFVRQQWRKIIAHKVKTFIHHFLNWNGIGSQTKAIFSLSFFAVDLVESGRAGEEATSEANSSNWCGNKCNCITSHDFHVHNNTHLNVWFHPRASAHRTERRFEQSTHFSLLWEKNPAIWSRSLSLTWRIFGHFYSCRCTHPWKCIDFHEYSNFQLPARLYFTNWNLYFKAYALRVTGHWGGS